MKDTGVFWHCAGQGELARPFDVLGLDQDDWRRDVAEFGPDVVAGEEADAPGVVPRVAVPGLDSAVHVFGPSSTAFDLAWELHGAAGLADWDAIIAVTQWAGRGQLRRPWESPAGNLHVAIALPTPEGHPAQTAPLLTGLALAEALAGLAPEGAEPFRVKWPNDLLWRGAKVGGLLLEDRGRLVAGLGLNLVAAPPAEMLRADHAVPAGTLEDWPRGPLRLWLALAPRLRRQWKRLVEGRPTLEAMGVLERRLAWFGEEVIVTGGWDFDKLQGIIVGISAEGALRLLTPSGERHILSGSLTPKALESILTSTVRN